MKAFGLVLSSIFLLANIAAAATPVSEAQSPRIQEPLHRRTKLTGWHDLTNSALCTRVFKNGHCVAEKKMARNQCTPSNPFSASCFE